MAEQHQDFLGRGWSFPLRPGAGGGLRWVGGDEIVRRSIWLILATAPGERRMLPRFGCGIHDLVFEANSETLRAELERLVREALVRWEPRVDVLEVDVETAPESRHRLLIRVSYQIRALNAFQNLVYPFYLDEGAQ